MAEQATLLKAPGAVGDRGALTGRDVKRRAAEASADASGAVGDLLLLVSWLRPATSEGSEAGSGLHAGSAADAVLAEAGSALAAGSAGTGLGSRSGAGSAVGLHSLGLGGLRERLGVLGRVRSVLAAVEAELVSEITRRQGTTAAEEVLAGTQRRSRGAARKAVRTAKDLQAAPKVADRLASGKITPEAAALITGAAGDTQVDQDYLLDAAGREPDDLFRRTVKRHVCERTKAEELAKRRKRQYRRRRASISEEPDGMWRLFAEFDPLAGSRIRGALYSAADNLYRREDPKQRCTQQQRLADALEELICTPTPTTPNPTRGGQRRSTNNDNGHRSRGGDGGAGKETTGLAGRSGTAGGGDRSVVGGGQRPDGVLGPNGRGAAGHEVTGDNSPNGEGGESGRDVTGPSDRDAERDREADDRPNPSRGLESDGHNNRSGDGGAGKETAGRGGTSDGADGSTGSVANTDDSGGRSRGSGNGRGAGGCSGGCSTGGAEVLILTDYDMAAARLANPRLSNDTPITDSELLALICDANIIPGVNNRNTGNITVGYSTRKVPPRLRKQLIARDRGCVGCGADHRICQVHHIDHWTKGGPTNYHNCCLLCWRCHHIRVHQHGEEITRHPNGHYSLGHPQNHNPKPTPPAEAGLEMKNNHRETPPTSAAKDARRGGPAASSPTPDTLTSLNIANNR